MIKLHNVGKVYKNGKLNIEVLKGVDIVIERGEFIAIMGPSGSGKTTLMNIIGLLDKPTSGGFILNESRISSYEENKLAILRNEEIGFVFQSFQLLPRMSALKNVELPLVYAGIKKKERLRRSKEKLKKVGLIDRITHFPNELSGGQKQRVAIARSLINNPSIILADEPTGALDSSTSSKIMELFREINKEGTTIIIVTHEIEVAQVANRIIKIIDGEIIEDNESEKII